MLRSGLPRSSPNRNSAPSAPAIVTTSSRRLTRGPRPVRPAGGPGSRRERGRRRCRDQPDLDRPYMVNKEQNQTYTVPDTLATVKTPSRSFLGRICLITLSCVIYSCSSPDQSSFVDLQGETMGTYYSIKVKTSHEDLQEGIDSVLEAFNSIFSTYDANSRISK